MHMGALHHTFDNCRTIHLTAAEAEYKLVEHTPITYASQHDPKESKSLEDSKSLYFSAAHNSYTKHSYCKKLAQKVF